MLAWPEDTAERERSRQDELAREGAVALGVDVESMLASAWQERQRALGEQ